jgi:formamidopyrimidine-DNA glycosylase
MDRDKENFDLSCPDESMREMLENYLWDDMLSEASTAEDYLYYKSHRDFEQSLRDERIRRLRKNGKIKG